MVIIAPRGRLQPCSGWRVARHGEAVTFYRDDRMPSKFVVPLGSPRRKSAGEIPQATQPTLARIWKPGRQAPRDREIWGGRRLFRLLEGLLPPTCVGGFK